MTDTTQSAANTQAATHTPGPWSTEYRIINRDGSRAQAVFPADDPQNPIAHFCWHRVKTDVGFTTNRQANATLCAAAPDMLAALKRFVDDFDSSGGDVELLNVPLAAVSAIFSEIIAKAEPQAQGEG